MTRNHHVAQPFRDILNAVPPHVTEIIDWSERFPNEDSRSIAIRQSTYRCCGALDCRKQKQIGLMTCRG